MRMHLFLHLPLMERELPQKWSGEASGEPVFLSTQDGVRYPSGIYARAFLGLLRAGEALARTLDADLRTRHDLTLRGYEVLLHLAAFSPDGRRLAMTQLARQAPLSQSRMSRLVAALEAQGLVRRIAAERDSRAVVVVLTDTGLDMLRRAQDTHHRELTERLFARLTEAEIAELARLTGKLLAGDGTAREGWRPD
jgi:DNA-binding MarR family transcriptional regulator